jgi:hypothetical protein
VRQANNQTLLKYLSIFLIRPAGTRGFVRKSSPARGRYGKLSTAPVDKQGCDALTAAWQRRAIGLPKKKAARAGGAPWRQHPDRGVPK